MIKLNSKILRAAQIFQGKDDIRKQLNGINIYGDEVTGSDGQTGVFMKLEEKTEFNGVISFNAKIPTTAVYSEMDNGTVIHYDANGKEKSRSGYDYQEINNMFHLKEGIPEKFETPKETVVLQPAFLKRIGEAFPQPKKGRCFTRLEHYKGGKTPIIFTVNTSEIDSCEPVVIIMPMVE